MPQLMQQRLLEAVQRGHWVMAGLPLSFPARLLYGFPAMLAEGLTVVISPTPSRVQSQKVHFGNEGMRFPAMAVLDGSQTPHEQRDIYQQINHNQVRLLCVTPKVFGTLNFLNALVHASLRGVVVEDAQGLLPDFSTAAVYAPVLNALHKLQQKPPLVLITQPLPQARQKELLSLLWGNPDRKTAMAMPGLQRLSRPVMPHLAGMTVARCLTEYQKLTRLVAWLNHRQQGSPGAVPVVIQTATRRDADRLSIALQRQGLSAVFKLHPQQTREQQAQIVDHARGQPGAVVLVSGTEDWFALFHSLAAPGEKLGMVYWQVPVCLEEAAARLFRAYGRQEAFVDGLLLYTREDYRDAMDRLSLHEAGAGPEAVGHRTALKRLRAWVLSRRCRFLSLLAYIQDERDPMLAETAEGLQPCGRCDVCLEQRGALPLADLLWAAMMRLTPLARRFY